MNGYEIAKGISNTYTLGGRCQRARGDGNVAKGVVSADTLGGPQSSGPNGGRASA